MTDFDIDNHKGKGRKKPGRPSRGGPRRDSDRPPRRDSDRAPRRDFDRSPRRDSRSRNSDQTMHTVICDDCKESCEVPFKPSSDKPIYCDNCFKKNKSSRSEGRNGSSKDLEKINEKLDKILDLLKKD